MHDRILSTEAAQALQNESMPAVALLSRQRHRRLTPDLRRALVVAFCAVAAEAAVVLLLMHP